MTQRVLRTAKEKRQEEARKASADKQTRQIAARRKRRPDMTIRGARPALLAAVLIFKP